MMMGGMGYGMVFGSLLGIVLLLGFAYIIWIFAEKEKGNVKMIGQGIAIAIVVLAAIMLLYGTIYGGMMGKGAWCDKTGWKKYKDMKPGIKMYERMEKYMKEEQK
jgi:hypothetical protein